ncbi:MAG: phage terminase large subunit [Magnetococcales bacterium]|nr:phage terminase large subunit [Magnetococcales bacterium]
MAKDLSPKAFQKSLAEYADSFREAIEAQVEGFDSTPKAAKKRQDQARKAFRFFAQTYFPHYVTGSESQLHQYLFQRLPALIAEKEGKKLAIAAPRGEAKSTIITQIFTLWCLLTQRKRFIPIAMDAYHQAAVMLEAIKAELEANPRLKQDFPEDVGVGRVWQEGVAVTAGGAKIQAFGSGKRVRGLRHGPHRPDLLILDDMENDESVRSLEQRDKLDAWLKKSALKLGPPDGSMDVIIVGTVLHHDSVLNRLLNDPLWESMRFQAIRRWPDEMPLWDRWEQLLRQEGEEVAGAFYKQNKGRMDAGAVVSWPGVRPLVNLMKLRADDHDAFDSELQNQPLRENATFGEILFWSQENPNWLYFGAVDPSMGKSGGRGDPSALIVVGLDRETGVVSVVEADIRRRTPDQIIEDIIALQLQYGCRRWVVETIQFQEFFKDELVKRSAKRGTPVPAQGVKPSTDKGLRISSIQPHLKNGLIQLHQSQKTLISQLKHWGEPGTHDDGPDALQMAFAAAHQSQGADSAPLSTPRSGPAAGLGGVMGRADGIWSGLGRLIRG